MIQHFSMITTIIIIIIIIIIISFIIIHTLAGQGLQPVASLMATTWTPCPQGLPRRAQKCLRFMVL